jgi:hypothetical protein
MIATKTLKCCELELSSDETLSEEDKTVRAQNPGVCANPIKKRRATCSALMACIKTQLFIFVNVPGRKR